MILTIYTADKQPVIVASNDLIDDIQEGDRVYTKVISYDDYILLNEATDSYDEF